VNIFVKPNFVETGGTRGSYIKPFGNIAKALEYADHITADKYEASVNIYLLGGGTHYMTTNYSHYHYDKEKSNKYSLNREILIQPVF
jgi:hypothetical protein